MELILLIAIVWIIGHLFGLLGKENKDLNDDNKNPSKNYTPNTGGYSTNYSSARRDRIVIDPNKDWFNKKQHVFEIQGRKCIKCGSKNSLHVHHIIPVCLGGADTISNLQILCEDCHEKTHGRHFKYEDDFRNDTKYDDSLYYSKSKLSKIGQAISNKSTIRIKYMNIDSQITERTIQPICINQWGGRIYVRAFCYLRKANRTFRVSRIKEIL